MQGQIYLWKSRAGMLQEILLLLANDVFADEYQRLDMPLRVIWSSQQYRGERSPLYGVLMMEPTQKSKVTASSRPRRGTLKLYHSPWSQRIGPKGIRPPYSFSISPDHGTGRSIACRDSSVRQYPRILYVSYLLDVDLNDWLYTLWTGLAFVVYWGIVLFGYDT